MAQSVTVELDVPRDLRQFRLPKAVNRRLQELLDKQSQEGKLTRAERSEAKGLVELAEMLTLLRLRAERAVR
jgi:hypothetical protein